MRSIAQSLAQKLDEGVTTLAYAWRLTRADGAVVAVTQHDRDLTFDNTTFVGAQTFVGSDSERDISLASDQTALSGALTIEAISEDDLVLGRWDQAKVEAFWVDWTNPSDFIPMWTGIVAGANWRGVGFELDIVGPESLLNRDIGRVYARTCDAALGDDRCKVDLSGPNRSFTASILSVDTDRIVSIAVPVGKTSRDFDAGVLAVLTGPATGWRSDISRIETTATVWRLSLSRPFALRPEIGDSIKITMGCDKSYSTCKARFANGLNFRGQPTMPGDDVAFGGPSSTGNDGGKR